MNILKASVASLVAVVFAQSAFADVTIRITGSSAFRAATHNAIKNVMNMTAQGDGYAYNGTNFTGASFAIFKGTIAGVSGKVTIKTSWSGSVAGLRDVVQSTPVAFLPDATGVSANGTPSASTTSNESSVPDVAMSDTFQGSTKYPSTPPLYSEKVGIIPFVWVASKDAPAGLTNMTPQLARALYKVGSASAALFTNNNADASDQPGGTTVYAAGRDPFSGTRLTAFAESGIGVNTVVAQYEPVSGTITNNIVGKIQLTAANTTDNVELGNNGFASGGNLADLLRYSTPSVEDTNTLETNKKICFVGYLGEADAARAVYGTGSAVTGTNAGNARYLSYNGVSAFGGVSATFANASVTNGSTTVTTTGSTAGLIVGQAVRGSGTNGGFIPSNATIASITNGTTFTISSPATGTGAVETVSVTTLLPAAIRNGAYTFWGYEQIMWRKGVNADKDNVATKISTQIRTVDYFASGLALDAAMRVTRQTDGGTVTQGY